MNLADTLCIKVLLPDSTVLQLLGMLPQWNHGRSWIYSWKRKL